jgi:hypothetical protein
MGTRATPTPPMPHQLSLPFQDQEVGAACLQPALPPLLPQHVWTSLSPTTRAQVRATIRRILQEIWYDDTHAGQDHRTAP